jgi:hypothetical protein
MKVFLTMLAVLGASLSVYGQGLSFGEGHPRSFEDAKKLMMNEVYRKGLLPRRKLKRRTFYCNQKFTSRKKTKLNRDYNHYDNYDRSIRYLQQYGGILSPGKIFQEKV